MSAISNNLPGVNGYTAPEIAQPKDASTNNVAATGKAAGALGAAPTHSAESMVPVGSGEGVHVTSDELPVPKKDLAKAVTHLTTSDTKLSGEAVSKNVTTSFSNGLDIGALLIKIMGEVDELRKLANQQKINEREATLGLQMKSAHKMREAGKEKMNAAIISGSIGIAAGAVSVAGSIGVGAFSVGGGLGASKIADKFGAKFGDMTTKQVQKMVENLSGSMNGVVKGVSDTIRSGGEMGAGIKQVDIANVEAAGKEFDAFSQAANSRADSAQKLADDLLQTIQKTVDNFAQLNSIINQGASNVISKMA